MRKCQKKYYVVVVVIIIVIIFNLHCIQVYCHTRNLK